MTDAGEDKAIFRAEAERYDFRCECQDCAFYDAAQKKCTHGYPTLQARRLTEASPLAELFCKEFTIY